jgi:DNA-binding response OmpR family regulator
VREGGSHRAKAEPAWDNDRDVDILVAEDDRDIADLIAHYFSRAGWRAHVTTSGDEALASARRNPADLVILDLMLPGLSGLEVCRALRADKATASIPIIMLTARAEESDRIIGLEIGADDYISKPFSPNELVARVRALMRRSKRAEPAGSTLAFGPLVMDLGRHTVLDEGREVKLTAKEFMLLQYLLQHRGRVLSRDLLLGDVWGYRYTGGTRTVDVHVRRLREKLPFLVDALVTVKQFGYKLVEDGVRS